MNGNHRFHKFTALLLCCSLLGAFPAMTARAQTLEERIKDQQSLPIESNEIPGWPEGPVVTAQSAILMEAGTGVILYAKNIHQAQYPASCTKLLTCLIAAERCSLDETVTMSHDAVFDTPLDSSYISLDVGNQITMEQALNAILISSANNVAFAVAEHITGTNWEDFGAIMNERAEELGCVDSHFVNPNGLPDENHYTSAYDLATIGRAFFDNELLCKISHTSRLHLPPTETQPKDIYENSKNRLLPGQSMAYEYLVGSKTGYTDAARNCLVSCAEKDGLKLICVVLKDESPRQFEDTVALFEYGFRNFKKINVSSAETKYNLDMDTAFYSDHDIFGSSRPLLQLNSSDYLVLPSTADFGETLSSISYNTKRENQAALITYTYHGTVVGTASVDFMENDGQGYVFGSDEEASLSTGSDSTGKDSTENGSAGKESLESGRKDSSEKEGSDIVLINLKEAALWTAMILAFLLLLVLLGKLLRRYLSYRAFRRRRTRPPRDTLPYMTVPESRRKRRRDAVKSARSRRRRAKRSRNYDF